MLCENKPIDYNGSYLLGFVLNRDYVLLLRLEESVGKYTVQATIECVKSKPTNVLEMTSQIPSQNQIENQAQDLESDGHRFYHSN